MKSGATPEVLAGSALEGPHRRSDERRTVAFRPTLAGATSSDRRDLLVSRTDDRAEKIGVKVARVRKRTRC